jgi:hypothetical protein
VFLSGCEGGRVMRFGLVDGVVEEVIRTELEGEVEFSVGSSFL